MFTYAHGTLIKISIDFMLYITSISPYFQTKKWPPITKIESMMVNYPEFPVANLNYAGHQI
jgi:hypothetical protein